MKARKNVTKGKEHKKRAARIMQIDQLRVPSLGPERKTNQERGSRKEGHIRELPPPLAPQSACGRQRGNEMWAKHRENRKSTI